MSYFYGRALTRSIIATIIIGAWIIWYGGPSWAWFLLAFYVAFTFALATYMEHRIKQRIAAKEAAREAEE